MTTPIDPFNFPGLSANIRVADKNGMAAFTFVGWFNSLLDKLKTALNQITANVLELETLSAKVDQQGQNYNSLAKIAKTGSASDLVAGTVPTARLATVNSNVGTFGDATNVGQFTVDAKGRITAAANIPITGGGSGITALTGDVTATGPGSVPATIASHAVTFAKFQAASGGSLLLGRGDSGAGDFQEITLGDGLSMTGAVLKATGQPYQPLSMGTEPLVFMSDGMGNPMMIPFSP
jgi:hypothetical protein